MRLDMVALRWVLGQRRHRPTPLTAEPDAHTCASERNDKAEARRGTGATSL